MAAYPTLPTNLESAAEPIDSRILVRATNGALKMRQMHSSEKLRFVLKHDLSSAQKSSLDSHYTNNKSASFAYTWPGGSSYTVMYAARPSYTVFPSGYAVASVVLEEV